MNAATGWEAKAFSSEARPKYILGLDPRVETGSREENASKAAPCPGCGAV